MVTTWDDSPIAETLAMALRSIVGAECVACRNQEASQATHRVVSYREDFDYLWGLDNSLLNWLESHDRTLVLVWEETPLHGGLSGINIADCVTAFDWAVALSLTTIGRAEAMGGEPGRYRPTWRLLVLDLASHQHRASQTVRLFQRLQSTHPPTLAWVETHAGNEVEGLLAGCIVRNVGQEAKDSDLLRRLWIGALAEPVKSRDRHAIANLIGPQLLLGAMGAFPPRHGQTRALTGLLGALRLVPDRAEREQAPWVNRDVTGEWKNVNGILIDDLYDMGWKAFLEKALGKGIGILAVDRPDSAAFNLIGQLRDDQKRLRINEGIVIPRATGNPIVLFLDLRLFARRTLAQEREFMRELLALARQAPVGNPTLKWPGFTSDELARAGRWINDPAGKDLEDNDYRIALTLLPRLTAMVDPMLPIILFSSTGQKRIADKLRPYETIISDFDKPRFFGDQASLTIADMRVRFPRAVKRALDMLRARSICEQLAGEINSGCAVAKEHSTDIPYVEVFFDESGRAKDRVFLVGGLVVVYANEEIAESVHAAMPNWGYTRDDTTLEFKDDHEPKRTDDDAVAEILKAVTDRSNGRAEITAFVLRATKIQHTNGTEDDLTHPSLLDNLHRRLLETALELILFETLPSVVETSLLRCRVYVGSRMRSAREFDPNGKSRIAAFHRDFG